MSISHKKINEIEKRLNEVFTDESLNKQKQIFFNELKEILKYDEKKGSYSKEYYEKYNKKYYEKNKVKLNRKRVENAKIANNAKIPINNDI